MMVNLLKRKGSFKWSLSSAEAEEMEAYYASIAILWFVHLVVLSSIAPLLKSHYPRSLGFRETFIPLHIISALSFIPLAVMMDFEYKNTAIIRLLKRFAALIFFLLSGLHIFYSFSIPENMRLINQVKTFKNSNDTDVAFLTTYYLAIYTDCCFLSDEEAPAFDCNSTDFEMPCYDDEELFELFLNDFNFGNSKCFALTKFDPYGEADSYGTPSDGICRRSERSFFQKIGNKAYRRLWTLSIVCLFYGFLAFWFATEYFYFCLGDMM